MIPLNLNDWSAHRWGQLMLRSGIQWNIDRRVLTCCSFEFTCTFEFTCRFHENSNHLYALSRGIHFDFDSYIGTYMNLDWKKKLKLIKVWDAWDDENSQQSASASAMTTEINTIITNNLQSGSLRLQYVLVCWHLSSGDSSIAVGCLICCVIFTKTHILAIIYCFMKEVLVSW